jgi:hypothetical protein
MKEDLVLRWGELKRPYNDTVLRGANRRQVGIHPDLMLAHALDPRFKHLSFIEDEENRNALWNAILREMVVARQQQLELQPKPESSIGESIDTQECPEIVKARSNKRVKKSTVTSELWERILEEADDDVQDQSVSLEDVKAECEMELSKYKNSKCLALFIDKERREMHDPLQEWWKDKSSSYPTVWLVAQYYLAIPATSASSERSFSVAGRILNPLAAGSTRSDNFEEKYFVKQNMEEYLHPPSP